METYASFAILLLIVGLVLLVGEIFIPSGGIIAIAAVISLSSSIWCGWKAWSGTPVYWWSYLGVIVVAIPTVLWGMFTIFPRTSMGKRILLEPPSAAEVSGNREDHARLSNFVGRTGRTVTLLNPGGLMSLDDERLHCESEGMMIDHDVAVVVIRVKGNDLVVREQSDFPEQALEPRRVETVPEEELLGDTHELKSESTDDSRVDFDVPPSNF